MQSKFHYSLLRKIVLISFQSWMNEIAFDGFSTHKKLSAFNVIFFSDGNENPNPILKENKNQTKNKKVNL